MAKLTEFEIDLADKDVRIASLEAGLRQSNDSLLNSQADARATAAQLQEAKNEAAEKDAQIASIQARLQEVEDSLRDTQTASQIAAGSTGGSRRRAKRKGHGREYPKHAAGSGNEFARNASDFFERGGAIENCRE